MALKFCCIFFSCLRSPDDSYSSLSPAPPEGSGDPSSIEEGGFSSERGAAFFGSEAVPKVSNLTNSIKEAAEVANVDLDVLIDHITQLLEITKKKIVKEKVFDGYIRLLLQSGSAPPILSRITETWNTNTLKEKCLFELLEEVILLAKHVKELQEEPTLKYLMKDLISKARNLILEASKGCCTQIDSSRYDMSFLTTTHNKFSKMYNDMDNRMRLWGLKPINHVRTKTVLGPVDLLDR